MSDQIAITVETSAAARNKQNNANEPALNLICLKSKDVRIVSKIEVSGPSRLRFQRWGDAIRLLTNAPCHWLEVIGDRRSEPRLLMRTKVKVFSRALMANRKLRKRKNATFEHMIGIWENEEDYTSCHECEFTGPCVVLQGYDHPFGDQFTVWIETDSPVNPVYYK